MSAGSVDGRGGAARPIGASLPKIAGFKPSREQKRIWNRGDSPRSGEPVWRNSYTVGTFEFRDVWKPINGGKKRNGTRWVRALLKAARGYELKTRAQRRKKDPGTRNGAIGAIGMEVLEYLYDTVDYANGRLEPAIRTIADKLQRSYSAVSDALKRLRTHGFLNWIRRSQPIDDPVPGGPQVQQASNAYALLVPPTMRAWLSRTIGDPPTPACEEDRIAQRDADFQHMISGLSSTQFMDEVWRGDALLGETLKRLARAVDHRDSQKGESGRADETGVSKDT
ncbi:MAG: hypothetical protein WA908_01375 [Pontixanthobacter sp.]